MERLTTTLERGSYIGTIHRGRLKDLLAERSVSATNIEGFMVVLLDKFDEVISSKIISVGEATTVVVSIRDVFKEALKQDQWSKIIVAHNHPDGDPTPSEADRTLTQSFINGGKLLGVEVVDHIVIGDHSFYSFLDSEIVNNFSNVRPFSRMQAPVVPTPSISPPPSQVVVQERPVQSAGIIPPKPLKGDWYWFPHTWEWLPKPRKPDPEAGVYLEWSNTLYCWCRIPDTKTLLGKFYNMLKTK